MAQILDHNLTDTPIVDWLEVIAKAAALGQISDTDPEPTTAVGPQEITP
ncbi:MULTISPECIES: hypothetical protein [unclassified Rhodococcus (in: high G+C Gram-positive bacteria)]|nr:MULTISPECIES: hypothetical protein [unclassified Rhodococcus (in: high G+C Gram-positive bacteria)]